MSKFRILHVVWNLNVGGIETYVVNVLRTFDRDRFHMDVCCVGGARGALADEAESLGAEILMCPMKAGLWSYVAGMRREMTRRGYDAVCDYLGDFAGPSLFAAWRAGVPNRVAFYRSAGWTKRLGWIQATGARTFRGSLHLFATSILGNSRSVLRAFHGDATPGKGKLDVVYNGVDTTRFRPDRAAARARVRAEFGIPSDAVVIGHVGGFRPAKNHMAILSLFSAARREHGHARLLLVGDGELRERIEMRIVELGIADAVTLTGVRKDTEDLLSAMDVFLFPSLREGFPNALVEAQAAGLPVVGSDRPEFREVTPHENHDLLAPTEDETALLAILNRLIADQAERCRRAALGPPFVAARFRPDQNRDAFVLHLTRNGPRRR